MNMTTMTALAMEAAQTAVEVAVAELAESLAESSVNNVAKEFRNSTLESAEKVAREYAVSAVKCRNDLPTVQSQYETTKTSLKSIPDDGVNIDCFVSVAGEIVSVVEKTETQTAATGENCSDDELKNKLELVHSALKGLSGIVNMLNESLKVLPEDTSLGVMELEEKDNDKPVHVSSLLWELLCDVHTSFEEAARISIQCTEKKEWKTENFEVFRNSLMHATTGLLAICELRQLCPTLQENNIPEKGDEEELRALLEKNFPEWKDLMTAQAKRNVDKLVLQETTAAASNTSIQMVKRFVKEKFTSEIKQQITSKITNAAKTAGNATVQKVFSDRRSRIIVISKIPYCGWGKTVALITDASNDAKQQAEKAVRESVDSALTTEVMDHIKMISQELPGVVVSEHMSELDAAVQQTINSTVERFKPISETALNFHDDEHSQNEL